MSHIRVRWGQSATFDLKFCYPPHQTVKMKSMMSMPAYRSCLCCVHLEGRGLGFISLYPLVSRSWEAFQQLCGETTMFCFQMKLEKLETLRSLLRWGEELVLTHVDNRIRGYWWSGPTKDWGKEVMQQCFPLCLDIPANSSTYQHGSTFTTPFFFFFF